MRQRLRNRRGFSEIIASVILTAVVLTIGGTIWFYSQSATAVMTDTYIDATMETLNEVIERFAVEHVSNNTPRTELYVWVYNYGDVPITVDVYATINGTDYHTNFNNPLTIASKAHAEATLSITASSGDEIAIKAYSRRQNHAYYTYYMP